MMKFLASFRFALVLIFLSAIGVTAGTFIESHAGSHLLAEDWVYKHPLFQLLLLGYFLNILLSALSRYPFKKRHIPFLITHLGLLMMICGVFIKTQVGIQGHVQLIEGTASDDLIYPHLPALHIERKIPPGKQSIPIDSLDLIAYHPHAEEKYLYNVNGTTHYLNKLEEWIAYDKGFQGYAIEASDNVESPPLDLMQEAATSSLIDFQKSLLHYLNEWHEAGTWLFDTPYPVPLNWKKIPESTYRALFWIAEIFDDNLLETLEQRQWPLIRHLYGKNKQEQYETWMAQVYAAKDELPEAPFPLSQKTLARMLSAYLRLFPINSSIEAPLSHEIISKEAPIKKEDAAPALTLKFGQENISLLYNGMKWPSKDKNHLLRFQPHREKLPYLIRLHQALDIKHPGSLQTASYECTLTFTDKRTGIPTPCFLQMNRVFETNDGYRFYLSGMGNIDRYGVKSVQLVVNRDPAKMFLTYPGGGLIALGILLLFFRKKT